MGSTQQPIKHKEIEQVYPKTAGEKARMEKPYIYKPVPDMYLVCYAVYSWKWARSTSIAPADSPKSSPSATAPIREPSSSPSSSLPRAKPTSSASANAARRNPSATTPTKSTWASTSDLLPSFSSVSSPSPRPSSSPCTAKTHPSSPRKHVTAASCPHGHSQLPSQYPARISLPAAGD
jgi:hypothetical protein